MKKFLIIAVLALFSAGCTDADVSSFYALGDSASITCYSGGVVVDEFISTGKVVQIDGDGVAFRDSKTDKFVRAYADCIVKVI